MMQDKVIVVTGAAGGIGKAIVEQFLLANPCSIILVDHPSKDDVLCGMLTAIDLRPFSQSTLDYIAVDVTDPDAVGCAVSKIIEEHGHIDILVNAAGTMPNDPKVLVKTDLERDRKIFDVNFWGTVYWCRTVLSHMRKRGYGRIVNISSIAAHIGDKGNYAYAASKAAVESFTKTLSLEVNRRDENNDIAVIAVAPGIVETEMTKHLTGNEKFIAAYGIRSPYGSSRPEEIAHVITLAACMPRVINGSVIIVDGGFLNS